MSTTSRTSRPPAARRGYLLAGAIAVAGLAGAGVWAGTALLTEVDRPTGFQRIATPGDGTVELDGGDVRVVYAEGGLRPPAPGDIRVAGPDGAPVAVRPYDGDLRYDVPASDGDAVGTAVATFTATDDGRYAVGSRTYTGTLAVGRDLAPGAVRAVVLPALLGLASLVAGLVLAVRTATRRTVGA